MLLARKEVIVPLVSNTKMVSMVSSIVLATLLSFPSVLATNGPPEITNALLSKILAVLVVLLILSRDKSVSKYIPISRRHR